MIVSFRNPDHQHHHHRRRGEERQRNHRVALSDCMRLHASILLIGISLITWSQGVSSQSHDMGIVKKEELRVHTLTWNVGGSDPEEDFRSTLGLNEISNQLNTSSLPDIYVFGWQEVRVRVSYLVIEDEWIEYMKNLLKTYDFVKLKATKLQGIMICVFVRRNLLTTIRDVETSFVRTGFNGMWGNKGAVSVRFSMSGCSIAFVTAHLAAHDHMNDRRIQDYRDIREGILFKNLQTPRFLNHDHVVMMGDLNFRINDLTADQIYDRITDGSDKSRNELLQKDQLNLVRSQGEAFTELTESSPKFWPTYKFKVGSSVYDLKKRKPAFTDRILWKDHPGSDRVIQTTYRSHPSFQKSDHKPVSATFTMKLFRSSLIRTTRDATDHASNVHHHGYDHDDIVVDFRPIGTWSNENDDNEIYYAFRDRKGNTSNSDVSERISNREWDWIAVLPHDFDSLDQWISYAWVNESILREGDLIQVPHADQPADGSDPAARAAGTSGEEMDQQGDEDGGPVRGSSSGTHFSLRFDPILNPGSRYRLIYFHGENSTSVLGISEPFLVTQADHHSQNPDLHLD